MIFEKQSLVTFIPLRQEHFRLLSVWLQKPHVAQWWQEGKVWDLDAVTEKYNSCVYSYKINELGNSRPIRAFIIMYSQVPIGYIQMYDVDDFARDGEFEIIKTIIPERCATFDVFIGDAAYVGKGIGTAVLVKFLKEYIFTQFSACYVDTHKDNTRAIGAYKKAGFEMLGSLEGATIHFLMLKNDFEKVCFKT